MSGQTLQANSDMIVSRLAGVEVRTYKVIYDLLDDMRAAMEGQLRSVEERIPLGAAEVRLLFHHVSISHALGLQLQWCSHPLASAAATECSLLFTAFLTLLSS